MSNATTSPAVTPVREAIGSATVAEIREMLGDTDRDLLVRVNRWRREHGWFPRGYNNWWDSADRLTSVWWDGGLLTVTRQKRRFESFPDTKTESVDSVRDAIDQLATWGVLPVSFSSMYAAGRASLAPERAA